MLILCDIHNGHRMSSGLWAPEGPLLTLGFVPCVTFRPWWHILSTTFNGEEKWWKISFILCTSSLPTNTAGTQSITTPFLQASCHLPSCFLGVTVPISSEGFETITLHDQRNFAVNIISYLQSIWLCALLGWSWACQKIDRLFFFTWMEQLIFKICQWAPCLFSLLVAVCGMQGYSQHKKRSHSAWSAWLSGECQPMN